jgi:hypothetical protein
MTNIKVQIEQLESRMYFALPAPWAEASIAASTSVQSGSLNGGTYTVRGAGAISANATADALRFAYQPLSGDGYIIARVTDPGSTTAGQAGIMIREDLSAGARYFSFTMNEDTGASLQYRLNPSSKAYQRAMPAVDETSWIKLERVRNTINSYYSSDGVTWTKAGTESIRFGTDVYVGLVVTWGSSSVVSTATFTNVVVPQNILRYGASPSNANNTTQINNAINAAANSGNHVYVPPGTFRHSGAISLRSGTKLFGAGAYGVDPGNPSAVSELVGYSTSSSTITSTIEARDDSNVEISNLKISMDWGGPRLQNDASSGIVIRNTSNFLIQYVDVSGTGSTGIFVTNASNNGLIRHSRVHDTRADGIHVTNGSHHVTVEYNTVFRTGDDLIATVGYADKGPAPGQIWDPPSDIIFRNNNVDNAGMAHGRGIAAVGAHNVLIDNNIIRNAAHTGIIIVSENAYDGHAGNNITVTRNQIINPNTQHLSGDGGNHGGIYIGGRLDPEENVVYPISNVTIGHPTDPSMGNVITNSKGQGISVNAYTSNINIYNNLIDTVTGWGIRITQSSNVAIGSNTIRETGNEGIYVHGNGNTGVFSITNNFFLNINANGGNDDVIDISSRTGFASLTISGNFYTETKPYNVGLFIDCEFEDAIVFNNTTDTGEGIDIG